MVAAVMGAAQNPAEEKMIFEHIIWHLHSIDSVVMYIVRRSSMASAWLMLVLCVLNCVDFARTN